MTITNQSYPSAPSTSAPPSGEPAPYGWRFREHTHPDGQVTVEPVPLTEEVRRLRGDA